MVTQRERNRYNLRSQCDVDTVLRFKSVCARNGFKYANVLNHLMELFTEEFGYEPRENKKNKD